MNLRDKKCIPCEGEVEPFTELDIRNYLPDIPGWRVIENKQLEKDFMFADFVKAMAFVDKVADVAESEGHHPDILISYNKVTLKLSTHAIGGLSENDFILAAKIDAVKVS